jgi:hypothetical protein
MNKKNIYLGSWMPRTEVHLEELILFLSSGKSKLNALSTEKLKNYWKNLNILDIKTNEIESEKNILVKTKNLNFICYANGLIVFTKELKNLKEDFEILKKYSIDKFFPAFSYIFSLGAPIPKIFNNIKSVMPLIIFNEKITEKEANKYFSKINKKDRVLISKNPDNYFEKGENMVVFSGNQKDNEKMVFNIITQNDIKNQFSKILNLHRFLWEETEKIKNSKKIPYKKLIEIRDSVMDLESEVIFFKSRIQQINNFLKTNPFLSTKNEKHNNYWQKKFESLEDTGNYINEIWKITENNINSLKELVNIFYQEKSQKELNILQGSSFVGVITSVIAMGSVYGFSFKIQNQLNQVLMSGEAISFSFKDLFIFGSTSILFGILTYVAFIVIYRQISASKQMNKIKFENSKIENIKNMLN